VAAQLEGLENVEVELVKGGLGELRVTVDGDDAYAAGRLWFPRAQTVVKAVKPKL